MYDRQKRVFTFQKLLGTEENVGPGSYSPRNLQCCKYEIGYAPFESLAERKFQFYSGDAQNIPAPSEYSPKLPENKVKGCCSISNKAERFPKFNSFGPGPNAYTITSIWGGKKQDICGLYLPESSINLLVKEKSDDKKNKSCDKIAYTRLQDVPSIPSGRFVYGYEEGPDGLLHPQTGPTKDQTLGPAFYGPTKDPVFTRYRGCGWSKRTSERDLLYYNRNLIGPGQYDPYSDEWEKIVTRAKGRNTIESENPLNVPRYMDKIVNEFKKNNFPGPCSYYPIDNSSKTLNKTTVSAAPFNVETERFKEKYSTYPGPNTYELLNGAIKRKWLKRFQTKPFDSSAPRTDLLQNKNPAPNSYHLRNSLADELARKAAINVGSVVGFSSTANRFDSNLFAYKNIGQTAPGPADYKPEAHSGVCKGKLGQTLSTSKRDLPGPKSVAPAPGSYDLIKSFDVTQAKRVPAPPITKEGKQRRGCFSTTAERFGKNSNLGPKDPNLPGPSDYCIMPIWNADKGKFVYQSERFKQREIDTLPGPADYQIAPTIQSCLRLNTFNVTLSHRR